MNTKKIWQRTQVDAMLAWWMAKDETDALNQISANPSVDLAGIDSSVKAGLSVFDGKLGLPDGTLYNEQQIEKLSTLTEIDVVNAIDWIHLTWRQDNRARFLEKCITGDENQFRMTQRIGWSEASKDLLFVRRYLEAAGISIDESKLKDVYEKWSEETADDLIDFDEVVGTLLIASDEILQSLEKFRLKLTEKSIKASRNNDQATVEKLRKQIVEADAYLQSAAESCSYDVVMAQLVKLGWTEWPNC